MRSIFGVALCERDRDRVATASGNGILWARARTAPRRRFHRRPPKTPLSANAATQNVNATPIAQTIAIEVSRSSAKPMSQSPESAEATQEMQVPDIVK